MGRRLQSIVKECRELLEKESLTHTASLCFADRSEQQLEASVCETALGLFIELTILYYLKVQDCEQTAWLPPKPTWDTLRHEMLRTRQYLQTHLPVSLTWVELSSLTLSPSVLKTLLHLLGESISSDEWRSDHILGWLYESYHAETSEQKQHGRFYTPETVTSAIVTQAFELLRSRQPLRNAAPDFPERTPRNFRILDLGCGCGAFALQVFEQLFQWYQDAECALPDLSARVLSQHLYLIDNDPWACQIAALSLYMKAKHLDSTCHLHRLNILCANVLCRWENVTEGDVNNGHAHEIPAQANPASIRELFTKQFDLVVGNPPYIVVNQLRAPKELIALYKSFRSAAYKINTFPLFIERGIELLKPHGILGMVVPNTLLTQMYFEPLRRYILQTCKILRILDTKRVFENAFVENCILLLERDSHCAHRSEHYIECVASTRKRERSGDFQGTEQASRHIAQRHFEHAPFLMFQVHLDDGLFELMEHIAHDAPTLGDICESHDGVNPGNAKRKLIVSEKLDTACKKVLNGKNIGRYWLHWDGLYVRYDRSLLSKGDNVRWGHQAALDSAKILTRQTADRLIGTFDPGEYYVTNSIHTTVLQKDRVAVSLKYVLAVINSRLLSFYYRKLFPEVGQVFSQVKLVNLRQLPLKLIPASQQQKAEDLVEQLLEIAPSVALSDTYSAGDGHVQHAMKHKIDQYEMRICRAQELNDQLDTLVYAAYDLTDEQIGVVEQEFGKRVTRFPKVEIEALQRDISYGELHRLYCRQRLPLCQIAARYHVHPESVIELRKHYAIAYKVDR